MQRWNYQTLTLNQQYNQLTYNLANLANFAVLLNLVESGQGKSLQTLDALLAFDLTQ